MDQQRIENTWQSVEAFIQWIEMKSWALKKGLHWQLVILQAIEGIWQAIKK